MSRYYTFVGGNLVIWRSKKQNILAIYSDVTDFLAMAQGIWELLRLNYVIEGLKINSYGPMKLFCDNRSVITIGYNPVQCCRVLFVLHMYLHRSTCIYSDPRIAQSKF